MKDKESIFSPCIEHCYIRYGKQYTSKCDSKCAYAMVAKNNKNIIDDLKYYLDTNEENGVVYIPKFVIEKYINLK